MTDDQTPEVEPIPDSPPLGEPSPEAIERIESVEGVDDDETEEKEDPQERARKIVAALPLPDPKVLLELAVQVCLTSPLPWLASNGRLYWDDEEPLPFDRAETIVGRFGSTTEGTLNAQFAAQAASGVASLILGLNAANQKAMDARATAGRLADAVDQAIESGGCDSPTADLLKKAVAEWEGSLSDQGVTVSHGPIPKGAGVTHDPEA